MSTIGVTMANQRRRRLLKIRRNKKKRGKFMDVKILEKYIGKYCKLYDGTAISGKVGRILDVKGHWIEFETKKDIELINADYVMRIKVEH